MCYKKNTRENLVAKVMEQCQKEGKDLNLWWINEMMQFGDKTDLMPDALASIRWWTIIVNTCYGTACSTTLHHPSEHFGNIR